MEEKIKIWKRAKLQKEGRGIPTQGPAGLLDEPAWGGC
jgi:hypothetical protein